jgi:hypothetical protein
MSTLKKSYRTIGIIIAIVIIFAIFFLPIIPIQVTEAKEEMLISDKPTVSAGKAIYYSVYIDVSGKQQNVVYGSVVETAGYDINFYVFDQKNFNAWQNGEQAQAYVTAKRVKSYDFRFVPDHSDYYYFVLDNTFSWFTNKVPEITATYTYQITVTKHVSLYQLLIGAY